jgi:hypothetical protein
MDFATVAAALPGLLMPLAPLAQQWDPLSRHRTYMLMMSGPVKVDLLFDEPQVPAPPWEVRADTLQAIDGHFWDWVYWLASKHLAGEHTQVAQELAKLARHMLGPLEAHSVPDTIEDAIATYVAARSDAEQRLGVTVPRELEVEIRRGLRSVMTSPASRGRLMFTTRTSYTCPHEDASCPTHAPYRHFHRATAAHRADQVPRGRERPLSERRD